MNKWLSILLISAFPVAFAQAQQSGIPAKMTITGVAQPVPVFLQRVEDENLIFQLNQRPTDRSGPLARIDYIEFVARLDVADAVGEFNAGRYQGFINKVDTGLEFKTEDYWPFMAVENNFQDVFAMLMEAFYKTGQTNLTAQAAQALMQSSAPAVKIKGQSMRIRLLIAEQKVEEAEAVLEQMEDAPVAKLYLTATIQRAKELPQQALWTITELIKNYPNDLDWMPQAELLAAYLYQDLSKKRPDIFADSAIHTARQVNSIYTESNFAADAERLRLEVLATQEKAAAEAKALEEAEAQKMAENRERRLERARRARGGEEPVSESGEGNTPDDSESGNADAE